MHAIEIEDRELMIKILLAKREIIGAVGWGDFVSSCLVYSAVKSSRDINHSAGACIIQEGRSLEYPVRVKMPPKKPNKLPPSSSHTVREEIRIQFTKELEQLREDTAGHYSERLPGRQRRVHDEVRCLVRMEPD